MGVLFSWQFWIWEKTDNNVYNSFKQDKNITWWRRIHTCELDILSAPSACSCAAISSNRHEYKFIKEFTRCISDVWMKNLHSWRRKADNQCKRKSVKASTADDIETLLTFGWKRKETMEETLLCDLCYKSRHDGDMLSAQDHLLCFRTTGLFRPHNASLSRSIQTLGNIHLHRKIIFLSALIIHRMVINQIQVCKTLSHT